MADPALQDLIEQLRTVNDEGDEDDQADKILRKIKKLKNPEAVGLLLTFRSSHREWLDGEWDEIMPIVTSFEGPVYASEFGKVAPPLARASRLQFGDMISMIIGQDLIEPFLSSLPPLAAEDRDAMISRITVEEDEPDVVKDRVRRLHDGIRAATK